MTSTVLKWMLVIRLLSPLYSSPGPQTMEQGALILRVGLLISVNLIKNLPVKGERALVV